MECDGVHWSTGHVEAWEEDGSEACDVDAVNSKRDLFCDRCGGQGDNAAKCATPAPVKGKVKDGGKGGKAVCGIADWGHIAASRIRIPNVIFSLCTCVMCCCVISASAYTSAWPLSFEQNGVFTFVTASGCTDVHTAHSIHSGRGAGYCSCH